MKKEWVNTIVKNAIFEVSKRLGLGEILIETDNSFTDRLEYSFSGKNLLPRSLYLRYESGGYTVSGGIHSPSDLKSDLFQKILIGEIAERLFYENYIKGGN